MKRRIGITLIVVLNATFLWLICALTKLTYGIIVSSAGKIHAEKITREISNEILMDVGLLTLAVLILNFVIWKKLIGSKRPFRWTLLLTLSCLLLYTPPFLCQREEFFNFQSGSDMLQHYYNTQDMEKIVVILQTDTFEIKQPQTFLNFIEAHRISGPPDYKPEIKMILIQTNGNTDTITSDGQYFGTTMGQYFRTEKKLDKNELRNRSK